MTSDRTAQRLTRLLAMLPWVMANPGVTVDEVCARFGYAKGSELAKDLDLVFLCGLPGYGPGDLIDAYLLGDEVVIEDADYFSRPLRLTAAEALVLLAAGTAVLSSSAAPPALATAVRKLQAVVAPGEGLMAVDLGAEPEALGLVRTAARDGDVLEIEYISLGSGATTTREVEPWSVFSALGQWYLSAHCRLAGDERLFRLDRVRAIRATGERFEARVGPAPRALYSPSADDVEAVIDLQPQAAWVTEYYPVTILRQEGDVTTIEFTASDPIVTARLLLRLGASARLVAGAEVGEALTSLRERVLARYE